MIAVAIAAMFGLAFGSFANAAIDRLAAGRSLFGRSCCDACTRPLRAAELVPILGYLALRGRCATCHARIGVRTIVVEATCGVAFAALFSLATPVLAAATCTTLIVAVIASGVTLQRAGGAA